ncbi:hypothetical protein PR202_ga01893 [Eleusine coracana subsp. coracana]|uniref:TF-B3 domain-containing protein n=1 Tax=Eleusine coracana subsp. coracana TaxID=191504 RepID=A0AAV5BGU9_ELECO|nr:hypothetical protein PR202_ga01206 [Eleusine coracana subsp. coracana]GJM86074.1 hypothetical protein PR202_ga01893 [Eleusine coracana subsp. coracana]
MACGSSPGAPASLHVGPVWQWQRQRGPFQAGGGVTKVPPVAIFWGDVAEALLGVTFMKQKKKKKKKWNLDWVWRMRDSVPKLKPACRDRLRSSDSWKRDIQSDQVEEKGKKIQNGDVKVKNMKTYPVVTEKEKEKEKEKKRLNSNNNSNKKTHIDDCKKGEKICNQMKNGKASPISCRKKDVQTEDDGKEEEVESWNDHSCEREKARKRLKNSNCGKKIDGNGDVRGENYMWHCDSEMNNGERTATSSKEQKNKRPTDTNSEKKVQRYDKMSENNMQNGHFKVKSRNVSAAYLEQTTRKLPSSDNVKKKINGAGRNTSVSLSKNRMQSNAGKNRNKPITSSVKEKGMRSYESTEMMQHDGRQTKRNSIPPAVAPELEDLTNHHVYLEDSEGKSTKIRLSVVDGSLAFHRGWNIFVSEHQIKWGEFLLFKYTAKSTFSVQIFGRNSRERLHFDVGRNREGVRKKDMYTCRSHDDWIPFDVKSEDNEDNYHVSSKKPRNKEPEIHHVTVHSKEDPKIVECMVTSGPVPLDSRKGKEIIQRCRTHGMSPLRTKETRVIPITDLGSSIHENDIVMPVASTADSDSQHVAADTNKGHKRVQSGIGNGQLDVVVGDEGSLYVGCGTKCISPKCSRKKSASTVQSRIVNGPLTAVADEKGSLPDVECGTKCTSAKCSEKKASLTLRSGIVNGPLTAIDDDKGSLPDIECRTRFTPLKRGEEKAASTVQSEIANGTTAVVDDEKGTSPDVEYGAKCTSPKCRENKAASIDAAKLTYENDGTLKDVKLHDSDEELIRKQEQSSIHLECTTVADKYSNNGEMSVSQDSCRKYEAPAGFRCLEKWRNSTTRNRTVLDGTRLINPESTQKTDSKFVAEYREIRLDPGDKCFCSKDTHACSQPVFTMLIKDPSCPDRELKWKQDGTEINHSIDDKGAIVELRTKGEQLEPVGSYVDGPGDNNPVCANLVPAHTCSAIGLNPVKFGGTCAFVELQPTVPIKNTSSPDSISKCRGSRKDINDDTDGNGRSVSGLLQEDTKSIDILTPVKPVILESDDHSKLKVNMQFCIANTALKWLELPESLSDAVRRRKQDRNIIMLKDPMKRLWPVFYHENSIFVGFTAGWKPFAAANNLEIGDLCELRKEPSNEEPVYSVQITKK